MSLQRFTGSVFWVYINPTSVFQTMACVPVVVQNQQPGGTKKFVPIVLMDENLTFSQSHIEAVDAA